MESVIKQHIHFEKYYGEYYYFALPPVVRFSFGNLQSITPEKTKFYKAVYRFANRTGADEYWYEFIGVEDA
jgi:hypothetical protein